MVHLRARQLLLMGMKALEKFQINRERHSKFMKHQKLKDVSIYCVLEISMTLILPIFT